MTMPLPHHPAIAFAPCEAVLDRIHHPAVQLALWHRARPRMLDWLDNEDLAAIDDIDAVVDAPFGVPDLCARLHAAGFAAQAGTTALAGEIARQMRRFAVLTNSPQLRWRLDVVETDACRRFHMDYVSVRLLMPLVGPGTQWIMADNRDDGVVQELQPGHVGLFKGRLSVTEPAVLHRSPPIAGTGQRRLLLVLDPCADQLGDQAGERAA